MRKETKESRFIRIAELRTQKVLDTLRSLSKCARTVSYRYTPQQVDSIFEAVENEVARTKAHFSGKALFRLNDADASLAEAGTESYEKYKRLLLERISLGDLLRAVDIITALCNLIPEPNEVVEDAAVFVKELCSNLPQFQTGGLCPKCGAPLFLSDLPQYDETCYSCDENF